MINTSTSITHANLIVCIRHRKYIINILCALHLNDGVSVYIYVWPFKLFKHLIKLLAGKSRPSRYNFQYTFYVCFQGCITTIHFWLKRKSHSFKSLFLLSWAIFVVIMSSYEGKKWFEKKMKTNRNILLTRNEKSLAFWTLKWTL